MRVLRVVSDVAWEQFLVDVQPYPKRVNMRMGRQGCTVAHSLAKEAFNSCRSLRDYGKVVLKGGENGQALKAYARCLAHLECSLEAFTGI